MSDNLKPLSVAEEAKLLLGDNTSFEGLTDLEIKHHVVIELLLDADEDASPAYIGAAFNALKNGGDNRFAQARRAERKRREAALAAAPVVGGTN